MDEIKLASYAKVNLTLDVLGLRPDGYHEIDSVVQIIDLADELTISKAPPGTIEVESDAEGVPSGRQNLVWRACDTFFRSTRIPGGAICRIAKRIPAQAGLGGGSGNAAAAIAALNALFDCALPAERLVKIAAKLGSDVPLFIRAGTVRVRYRGQAVDPLADAPRLDLVILKPDIGVSTAWAYGQLDSIPDRRPAGATSEAIRAIAAGDRSALVRAMANDFDPVISSAFGQVAEARQALMDSGAERAMLAGSGSAVFGVFESRPAAEHAAGILEGRFKVIFLARSLSRAESTLVAQ